MIILASNRRGKHNSDHINHHSGSLSRKTSYICSIHNKWLSSWNDHKNHFAKQFSLLYTQGHHKIMTPKSFVLDLILDLILTESAVFQLCSFTVFPKDPFFRLFSLFYSLLETPNSWFLQDLRQNGVGRVFERVNMMQENNWLIRLNDKAILKESLHNQKLHRVLFVRVTLLDYILGAFVKSRATWCPRGLGTAGLMSRDLYLGEADVGALFIE